MVCVKTPDWMSRRKHILVIGMVALLATVSITGYTTLEATAAQNNLSEQAPSEETIEQHALNNTTTIESVTGTVTINSTIDNGTQPMQAQIWQQPPNHVRYEYVSGPNRGNVLVSNGSTIWMYNDSTNTVQRLQYNTSLTDNLRQAFQNLSANYTAEYQGQAVVSGQETYVVSVAPPNGTLGGVVGNQTVWLDQDTWFPVKSQVTTTVGNQTATTTTTYSNLTYNASIPADQFTFEPPEDATVVEPELPETTSVETIEAAENAVNFSVQEPRSQSLPDDYRFENGTVTQSGNTTTVSLIYANDSESIVFSQSTATQAAMRGEPVSIAGQSGSYQEIASQGVLTWEDDGFRYSVSGSVSQSTLIEVAESVYC